MSCVSQFFDYMHHFQTQLTFSSDSPILLQLIRGFFLLKNIHTISRKAKNLETLLNQQLNFTCTESELPLTQNIKGY